jgi:glycine oxidase
MKTVIDVAVVGGGVIGLTCAYELAGRGWHVGVWDRGALGQEASWAGTGIIPPGNIEQAATAWDRLRAIGAARFPRQAEELRELTGLDIGYRRCGALEFLTHPEAQEIVPLWAAEGIVHELWTTKQCGEQEPAVQPLAGCTVWHLPHCAQVRNPWLMRALIVGCARRGVGLYPQQEVVALEGEPPRAHRVRLADGSCVVAGRVLLAAGAWTDTLLQRWVGLHIGIAPVRGQIVLLRTEPQLLTRILLVGKRYLVPRGDGYLLVGSTEEPEAGFVKANTAEAVANLLQFATGLVPRLAHAELVRCWSGLRPGSPDGYPLLGPVPGWENVWVAAGHFRAGVQLSLGTAQFIAEVWSGETPCVPPAAVSWSRPAPSGPRAFRS